MKVTLAWLGAFKLKGFQQSASMRKAQLRVAITTVTLKGSSLIRRIFFCQDLSQCWLDKIRKLFSSKRKISWCSVGSLMLPLYWFRTTPEVSEELEIYFSPFLPLSFTFRAFSLFRWHSFAQLLPWSLFLCRSFKWCTVAET